jgi:hypothetical protein
MAHVGYRSPGIADHAHDLHSPIELGEEAVQESMAVLGSVEPHRAIREQREGDRPLSESLDHLVLRDRVLHPHVELLVDEGGSASGRERDEAG